MKAADRPLPHSISQLKSSSLHHAPQHAHINGHHFHFPAAGRDAPGPQEELSEEDEEESGQEEEDDEEEEVEEAPKKWQGIEAIFEAYQEYVDGESMSRQFVRVPLNVSLKKIEEFAFLSVIRIHLTLPFLWFLCASLCTEWGLERQVLHSQCKRLEAQNYNLTRTAEQLSLTMGVSIRGRTCVPASLCLLKSVSKGRNCQPTNQVVD